MIGKKSLALYLPPQTVSLCDAFSVPYGFVIGAAWSARGEPIHVIVRKRIVGIGFEQRALDSIMSSTSPPPSPTFSQIFIIMSQHLGKTMRIQCPGYQISYRFHAALRGRNGVDHPCSVSTHTASATISIKHPNPFFHCKTSSQRGFQAELYRKYASLYLSIIHQLPNEESFWADCG